MTTKFKNKWKLRREKSEEERKEQGIISKMIGDMCVSLPRIKGLEKQDEE